MVYSFSFFASKEKLGMFLDATPFKEGFASVLCENENKEKKEE